MLICFKWYFEFRIDNYNNYFKYVLMDLSKKFSFLYMFLIIVFRNSLCVL